MGRARPAITNTALSLGGAVGVVATLVLLVRIGPTSLLVGVGAGGAAGTLTYATLAGRHRRRLATTMATTVGELPPVPRETWTWPDAPPPPPPGFP